MTDMVLLKCNTGSKAATVLCPECGRISRQILTASYSPNRVAELIRPHTCPICETVYQNCSPSQAGNWSAAFARFSSNADAYNQSVRLNHTHKHMTEETMGSPSSVKEEESTSSVPSKKTQDFSSNSYSNIKSIVNQDVEQERADPIDVAVLGGSVYESRPTSDNKTVLSTTKESTHAEIPEQSLNQIIHPTTIINEEPSVSGEDLDRKIEHWKRELLDTGKRNKMINYRETKRATLRILEPEASELFNKLAFSEKPLTFQKPINKDTDLRTYSMIALMETLSYNLNVQVGDIKTAGTIIEREKTLKNLRSKAKLAQEEQGTNILYLCFGFIYWREQDRESSPWFKAPLLMMPVTLGLKSLNAPFTLSRYDDEIEVNPTLDYLFNSEYHIDLPTFELKNRQSIDDYFTQIEEIVDKRGWKVRREVSLGLLSFLKISMYHDLNEHRDLMVNHPVLRAMAGDRTAIGDLPPQTEHFDFDRIKPDAWHEVVNADSSQEEAILLSKLGVNFVMQGPPGTGKSQTITNIIAEALADGKKVLFVSEKAAALQVVLKRLTEVHLDDFCLSLHNYKANKKEIIDSIGANLSLEDEYIDSSALSELSELFHDRAFLNAYAGELHKTIAPLDQSVYMVFGQISKLEKATVLDFSLDNPTEITKEQYASIRYCVSAFEKALHNMGGKLSENPWFGTKATSSGQIYKLQLLQDTKNLSSNLRRITELARRIDSQLGLGETKSFAVVKTLLDIMSVLSTRPSYISRTWFDAGVTARGKVSLMEAKSHSERLHQYRDAVLNEWDNSILSIDPRSILDNFCGDFSWIYDTEESITIESRLIGEQSAADELKHRIEELLSTYHEGLQVLAYSQADTAENIHMVSRVLSLIAEAPYMEAIWFDTRKNAEIVPLINEALLHSETISSLTEEVLKNWESSALEIDADGMLARFKTEYVGMFHTWKSGYKEDIKTLRLHSKVIGGKIDESTVVDFLQMIKELKTEKAWFDTKSDVLKAALGSHYRGETTEWSRVRESMSKAIEITNEFPYSSIPEETISALLRITESLQLSGKVRRIAEALSTENIDQIEGAVQNCRFVSGYTKESDIREAIVPQISNFIENCGIQIKYVSEFTAAKKNGVLVYKDITTLLSNLTVIKEEGDWFEDHKSEHLDLFAEANREDESDWTAILSGYDTVDHLSNLFSGLVPETVIDIACVQNVDQNSLPDVSNLSALVAETEPKLTAFSTQFESDDFTVRDMLTVADRYDACMNGFGELNKWLDYVETKEECDKCGLSDFTAKVAERDNSVNDIFDSFERGFYIQWLNLQLDNVPAVQAFRRRIHEQRAERFVKLDEKQFDIARRTIRERIISTYPGLNRIARAGSELGILRHEMEKKRRIMPLRRLFREIPHLLLTLKPCLMMSPLSVAYFLDAEKYQFDLVVFDEASQIFPQDAIGAIFRAKQVIIAGDTKQLPPTNFFAASTSNNSEGYDDDEGYDDEVYDSILEETANILPNRTLLWHYRSKHEHLIAFSNQEIYKNDLVTFPSSNESDPDTGVEFVYVEDGYYEPSPRNYNILEARRIVDLVKEHIENHPDRSLGVIAFSEKQQQAITLEIQRFREKNAEYEAFFAEGKEDEFFVKNLENVQGDERDTIFFSIGYAKTKEQKANGRSMSMRFGPLGISGGERRLNVAITRAKLNVKLVSSILPSDIDLSRTESDGIRMLRSYIEFAMNGEATLAVTHRNSRPDDFSDYIAQFIRGKGFKVKQYVGCSGYRIDIAVEHPSDTIKQFVAGIECDGFSYVAARTARDRDRLRSTVLKNMGWNLYRVWSTEWYKNPEIEGQKLIEFLNGAIQSCDKKIRVLEEQKRKEEEEKKRELEKARAAREAEECKRQREQEEKEAKIRAEREEVERKRREAEEKKAAKLRAEQEAAKKREEERKRIEEQRLREAEAKRQRTDLSWVKPGVSVKHKHFGEGTILAIDFDTIRVRFATGIRTLSYPSVFENAILSKSVVAPEPPKTKVQDDTIKGPMDFVGNSRKEFVLYLKNKGYAETSSTAMASSVSRVGDFAIEKGYTKTPIFEIVDINVLSRVWCLLEANSDFIRLNNKQNHRFSMAIKHYFNFMSSASNAKSETRTEPRSDQKNEPRKKTLTLIETLRTDGFTCIDNRTTSSILWVLYEPAKKDEFDKIISGFNVQCKLEKRGALATNNSPAWRIMFN